jgi:hypothetical protein
MTKRKLKHESGQRLSAPAPGRALGVRTVRKFDIYPKQRVRNEPLVVSGVAVVEAIGIRRVEECDPAIQRRMNHCDRTRIVARPDSGQSHAAKADHLRQLMLPVRKISRFRNWDESCTSNPKSEVADWTLPGIAVLARPI